MKFRTSIAISFLIVMICASIPKAQELDTVWTSVYDATMRSNGWNVAATDFGCAVVGSGWDYDESRQGAYVVRMDTNGDTLWTSILGPSGTYGRDIVATDGGGFAYVGGTHEFPSDILIVILDTYGDTIWTKTIGTTAGDDDGYGIDVTTDGGFVVAGISNSQSMERQIVIAKLDGDGIEEFMHVYDDYYWSEARGIQQTSDGGYAFIAQCAATSTSGTSIQLIKTDSQGEIEWISEYEGFHVYNFQQTLDGGYIILGKHPSSFSVAYVIKTDSEGSVEWSNTYFDYSELNLIDVYQMNTGEYVCVGNAYDQLSDQYICILNQEGVIIWDDLYSTELNEHSLAVDVSESREIYVAGDFRINLSTDRQIFTTKYFDLAYSGVEPLSETPLIYEICSIYPNPFNPSTTVSLDLPNPADLTLKVFNNNGQLVSVLAEGQFNAGKHNFQFDGSKLTSGSYFIQAVTPEFASEVKRVMLVK